MAARYPQDFRDRAVRLVTEIETELISPWAAAKQVSRQLGITPETLRRWVQRSQIDAGVRPGTSTEESAMLRKLRRENTELRRANEILRTASAFFAAELDRPTTK